MPQQSSPQVPFPLSSFPGVDEPNLTPILGRFKPKRMNSSHWLKPVQKPIFPLKSCNIFTPSPSLLSRSETKGKMQCAQTHREYTDQVGHVASAVFQPERDLRYINKQVLSLSPSCCSRTANLQTYVSERCIPIHHAPQWL